MKAKKIAAVLLAGGMTLSAFAGTGVTVFAESADTESKITFPLEEPVTMTMLTTNFNDYLLENSASMKKMEELTNVHWEITYIPYSEIQEKKPVMVSGGQYPDVFFKGNITRDEGISWGSEGILIPLDDLLREYAPNYCAIMDEQNLWDYTKYADGHYYTTAGFETETGLANVIMWINQTWLDRLGLEMPTTQEEFYEVLKAFKENDADGDGDPNNEIPFMTSSDLATVECMPAYMGLRYAGFWDEYALSEDDEIFFWPASDEWKNCLSFLTQLYEEGLMYSECFNTTIEQARAMGMSGQSIGCFFEWDPQLTVGSVADGGKNTEYVAVPPFEDNKFPTIASLMDGGFAITDKCEYPEIATAWVDYFYSEEGANLAHLGVEGVTYTINEDGTWDWIKDGEYGADVANSGTIWLGGGVAIPEGFSRLSYYDQRIDEEANPGAHIVSDTTKELVDNDDVEKEVWPAIVLSEEESETKATIDADINPYWKQYRAQVITGQLDLEESWDEYLTTLENMGLFEMNQCYIDAYARLKAE